jgi:hypothetical protein
MKQKNNIVDAELISKFQLHTKLSDEQKRKLINWFIRQNLEFQLLIFDEQGNQFFKLKNNGADKKLLSFASFLLAIKCFYDKEQLLKSKNKSQSLNKIGDISRIDRIKYKKEKLKPKLQRLLSLYSVIKQFHNDGYSSTYIQDYLLKKYKFNVCHTYICKFINEYIKNEKLQDVQ